MANLLVIFFIGIILSLWHCTTYAVVVSKKNPPLLFLCTGYRKVPTKKKHKYVKAILVEHQKFIVDTNISSVCKQQLAQSKSIKFKVKGYSSASFAKKQYKFKFIDHKGKKQRQNLLNLPKHHEFALHGPYVDRSYIRNALSYRIANKIAALRGDNWWAPRFRFVELVINDDYKGLYLLTETIKRNYNRIRIASHQPKSSTSAHLKSFIVELSSPNGPLHTSLGLRYKPIYPSKKKLAKWQDTYFLGIKNVNQQLVDELNSFESQIKTKGALSPTIDMDSFIDYIIIQEVTKNIDGYRRSAILYKNNYGKVIMGPVWDFNLSLGNLNFIHLGKTKFFIYKQLFEPSQLIYHNAFWFKQLMKDHVFKDKLHKRYCLLRQKKFPLHEKEVTKDIKILSSKLHSAAKRDQKRWYKTHTMIEKILLNTAQRSYRYQDNLNILQNWILKRLKWLDNHWVHK